MYCEGCTIISLLLGMAFFEWDGRKWIFEKMVFPDEMAKNTKIYRSLVLEDITPENELKEYVNEIKKNS